MTLHIVLYQPEIIGNVGAIMRTCVAVGAKLHLIEPFGFYWDERVIERTSVHLVQNLDYQIYSDFDQFFQANHQPHLIGVDCSGSIKYSQFNFAQFSPVFLLFGQESSGLPLSIRDQKTVHLIRIPMRQGVRSLNLATSVAVVAFEVCRQVNHSDLI